ncbi:transporter [Anoxybacillus gonensis]|uniref:Sodium-dependent transporter n=1 Tax=Anoxybacillus gonensis TaxID=198467 RepID=A0AAW7TJS1_9BACL|nr:sodium-dependent transporter [Anoxybacillus gonensis]AXM89266.1 sodium-dependent transporter [Anoxybacillus ayderensis G10]AKS39399.1 transporter [Anoxybacillus gonensis]KGP60711.1 transporter [Anoxybacillus gonensis]MCX8046102.1 sodium-dependent transporter [Anoxybacillus gonensis]MDO0877856.1 sodium-dependent transporter [Anoxybacillus gonensis]
MESRQQWGTRAGFILAAAGSAIGLGNIWRFPAVAYENGGGAFFLPYLFALLTAGIPILILEFALGHKYRGSAPLTFARLSKGTEWIGWWQVLISFVISTYYSVVIAWAMSYTYFAFTSKWGENTGDFLFGEYLKLAETPGTFGSLVPAVFIPLLLVWIINLAVLYKGVRKGIEVANKIFLPTLIVLFLIIVIRAVTLDGAIQGLNAFFKPNWDQIMNGKVWLAAYSQIFFSLSIAFAIMITYSSYLPKKSDITNNAFITGFANSGFELLAGIGVFSVLGFLAQQQGVEVSEVVKGGVGLAFVVFPQIINQFPAFNELFGVLFFLSLTLAGLTSLISISETYVSAIQEKFGISRTKAVLGGGGVAALIALIFASNGGLYFLDVVDYFINNFGVALVGLVEVVVIAWVLKELNALQTHANSVSDIMVGAWWKISLSVVTPIVLGYMMFDSIKTNVKENYGGYDTLFVVKYGWTVAALVIVLGFVLSVKRWKDGVLSVPTDKEVSS